jgi:hypothetical protein
LYRVSATSHAFQYSETSWKFVTQSSNLIMNAIKNNYPTQHNVMLAL